MHHTRLESDGIQQALSQARSSWARAERLREHRQRIQSQYELDLSALEKPEGLNAEEAQVRIEDLRCGSRNWGRSISPLTTNCGTRKSASVHVPASATTCSRPRRFAADHKKTTRRPGHVPGDAEGIKKGFVQIFHGCSSAGDARSA